MEALVGRASVDRVRCLTAWWICPRPLRGRHLKAGLVRRLVDSGFRGAAMGVPVHENGYFIVP